MLISDNLAECFSCSAENKSSEGIYGLVSSIPVPRLSGLVKYFATPALTLFKSLNSNILLCSLNILLVNLSAIWLAFKSAVAVIPKANGLFAIILVISFLFLKANSVSANALFSLFNESCANNSFLLASLAPTSANPSSAPIVKSP